MDWGGRHTEKCLQLKWCYRNECHRLRRQMSKQLWTKLSPVGLVMICIHCEHFCQQEDTSSAVDSSLCSHCVYVCRAVPSITEKALVNRDVHMSMYSRVTALCSQDKTWHWLVWGGLNAWVPNHNALLHMLSKPIKGGQGGEQAPGQFSAMLYVTCT